MAYKKRGATAKKMVTTKNTKAPGGKAGNSSLVPAGSKPNVKFKKGPASSSPRSTPKST